MTVIYVPKKIMRLCHNNGVEQTQRNLCLKRKPTGRRYSRRALGANMMRIEYLADRLEFIPELARLHFQEWGYLRPEQTLEARTESLTCPLRT